MRYTAHIAVIAALTLMPSIAKAEDLAQIYVYAQQETPARSWRPISCDGKVVAKLKRGRFFALNVAPGRHMLSYENGVDVFVDARRGEDSFVRLEWHFEITKPALPILEIVTPSQARQHLMLLSYIDGAQALSSSVPKADPRKLLPPRLSRRESDEE